SVPIGNVAVDGSGTSAHLSITIGAKAGTFVLVASNPFGSSTREVTSAGRFTVIDPSSTADSDGDGVPDVLEAFAGSDPLDSADFVPLNAGSRHAYSLTLSLLNTVLPGPVVTTLRETDSLSFSLSTGT